MLLICRITGVQSQSGLRTVAMNLFSEKAESTGEYREVRKDSATLYFGLGFGGFSIPVVS
jgi:hypothetical protein